MELTTKKAVQRSSFLWRPLKVRVFIMQLIGWIEFGIRPDSVQSILLLFLRGYTSRCNLQFVVLILHSLLISLHNTFLALKCQKNSPLKHCLRRSLYVTCFGIRSFSLMYSPTCCAGNAILDLNGSLCGMLRNSLCILLFHLKVP